MSARKGRRENSDHGEGEIDVVNNTMRCSVATYVCTAALTALSFVPQAGVLAQSSSPGYHVIDTLLLGGEGGWDYLSVDAAAHRVYVSRGTHMQVVDTKSLAVVGDIPNTLGIHGIALIPSMKKGYTSNGRDSSVTVVDLESLKELRKIRIDARNPDAILYEPVSHRVFTFNGGSENITAIDPVEDKVVGTLAAGGKPENVAYDSAGHVFVNVEDKSTILEFDARTLAVVTSWSIAPGEEPSGMAIDRENKRLFSVCRNKMMVVSDCVAGKVLAHLPIGAGVDGAAFDPTMHLAFSSNGEGSMSVVRVDGPDKFSVVETVPTRRGARTCAIDESTHRLYTISAKFEAPAGEGRPKMLPGSAALYVIGQ